MNNYKKIALKLWQLSEDDRDWVLENITDADKEKVSAHLADLQGISPIVDSKAATTVFEKYLSYTNQEIDLLNDIDNSQYQSHFRDLVKSCLVVNGDHMASKRTKIQLLKMASQGKEV